MTPLDRLDVFLTRNDKWFALPVLAAIAAYFIFALVRAI
jgi:hypothetical protein